MPHWIRVAMYLSLLVSPAVSSSAQQNTGGIVTGTVTDAETKETMVGAAVVIDSTAFGTMTDIDGNFTFLKVKPGTYSLTATMVGYDFTRVQDVIVAAGKTVTVNIALKSSMMQMNEVVIKADIIRDSDAALLKDRQKAVAVQDAVSAETITKTASGNAAEAVKQVTGTTVVGGKSVYVRGLGDRYMNVQLNGSDLPSTSQYNQTVQIDLFPSSLISNIVTLKTFTPDKPGSFTGGSVNIETKAFPEKLTFTVSASSSYNPQANLVDSYLNYDSGSTWTGMADSKLDIPSCLSDPDVEIPRNISARRDYALASLLDTYSKSFNNIMLPSEGGSPMNQSYGVTFGNRTTLFNRPLGYLGSVSYNRSFSSYDDGKKGIWYLTSPSATGLQEYMNLTDHSSTEDVLWGGLANLTYQIRKNHEIGVNYFHSQNGEKTARHFSGTYAENISTDRTFSPNVLSYTDRSLRSVQFHGNHRFGGSSGVKAEWRSTFSRSNQNEPDLRYFSYTYNTDTPDNPSYSIFNNYFQHPTRTFRELTEKNSDNALDITVPFKIRSGRDCTLKFGGAYSRRDRTFVQRQFEYQIPSDGVSIVYAGDSGSYFSGENMGLVDSTGTGSGTKYLFGLTLMELKYPSSRYDGSQDVSAGYSMVDLGLTGRLRLITGARYETTKLEVSNPDETGKINAGDVLPSVNLVYTLLESMNLRGAYSRTLARPTIREMAPYATYDFGAGAYVVGNPRLKRTLISNYDLRWEWFTNPGDVYSVSFFYKDFTDPIERVIVDYDGQTTFENVDKAVVMGMEFEARQSLGVFSRFLGGFKAGGNISLVRSEVDIPEKEMVYIRAYDPGAKSTREFMGQSPYVLNLDLSWENEERGFSSTLFYNVFGKRLSENALGGTPDVYEKPASMLNITFSKKCVSRVSFKFSAKNLLNSRERKVQEYRGKEYIRSEFGKGRSFSLGVGYTL